MFETIIGFSLTLLLAATGGILNKFNHLEKRLDAMELTVARDYMSKKDFEASLDRVYKAIDRFETKLDYLVYGDTNGKKIQGP